MWLPVTLEGFPPQDVSFRRPGGGGQVPSIEVWKVLGTSQNLEEHLCSSERIKRTTNAAVNYDSAGG